MEGARKQAPVRVAGRRLDPLANPIEPHWESIMARPADGRPWREHLAMAMATGVGSGLVLAAIAELRCDCLYRYFLGAH